MIIVSACLAGQKVRYNGTDCLHNCIMELIEKGRAISVCPEILGGFQTPREPAEIIGGDGYDVLDGNAIVVDKKRNDVTQAYLEGAYKALQIAQDWNAKLIVLKENSPSCGSGFIYAGSFNGVKKEGVGVTTALFRRKGIEVISEHYITTDVLARF